MVIADLQRQLDGRVEALRATTLTVRGRWAASVEQHDAIVEAVNSADAPRASELAAQHLHDARALWVNLLSRTG